MPVELRKRKAPPPPPEPPAKKQAKPKATKAAAAPKAAPVAGKVSRAAAKAAATATETVKETATKVTKAAAAAAEAAAAEVAAPNGGNAKKPEVGDVISLEGFGGEVETNDGDKTTLKALVDESKAGVVLFTYPKASTPGCTRQVCFFRDSYEPFTAAGFAIYGLSGDSPKANTTFKDKQKLQYSLLCDPAFTLIGAIGLKKAPKGGTTRGVFVVDKSGKVLAAQAGSPEGTLNVVKKVIEELGGDEADEAEAVEDKEEPAKEEAKEEEEKDEEAKPNGKVAEEAEEKTKEKKEDEAEKKEEEKDDDEVLPDAPPAPAAEDAEKEDKEEKKE